MLLSSLQPSVHLVFVILLDSGLSRSIFTNPWSILMILIGLAGVSLGVLGLIQTRRWPQGESARVMDDDKTQDEKDAPPQEPPQAHSTTTREPPAPVPREDPTSRVQIELPRIHERHPDVWGHDEPLEVAVRIEKETLAGREGVTCTLFVRKDRQEHELDRAHADPAKRATFTIRPPGKGDAYLVARLHLGDENMAENARFIRFVDYRNEIVETFEDFEKWARTHYPLPKRSLTAREFTDRYADLVPGTPVPPLDLIVDVYELANFSDHGVDRSLYLQLVDAFLELEDAGSLEGPVAEGR